MIRLLFNIIAFVTRRGRGIFKFLFTIDDLFRLFAITILLPILFDAIGLKGIFIYIGIAFGLVIDIHDFVTEFATGKLISKQDIYVLREKYGWFKFLFIIDDLFRTFLMTILIPIILSRVGAGTTLTMLCTLLGLVIDIHDLYETLGTGKLRFELR